MKLVKIVAEDSPYYGMDAIVFSKQDTMIILSPEYPFDYYKEERVPIYDVLEEDVEERLVEFITKEYSP